MKTIRLLLPLFVLSALLLMPAAAKEYVPYDTVFNVVSGTSPFFEHLPDYSNPSVYTETVTAETDENGNFLRRSTSSSVTRLEPGVEILFLPDELRAFLAERGLNADNICCIFTEETAGLYEEDTWIVVSDGEALRYVYLSLSGTDNAYFKYGNVYTGEQIIKTERFHLCGMSYKKADSDEIIDLPLGIPVITYFKYPFVPLREVYEKIFGLEVGWDAGTSTVILPYIRIPLDPNAVNSGEDGIQWYETRTEVDETADGLWDDEIMYFMYGDHVYIAEADLVLLGMLCDFECDTVNDRVLVIDCGDYD